jgi:hypothetical protein
MTSLRDRDETAAEQQVTPEESPRRTAADVVIGSLEDLAPEGWPHLLTTFLITFSLLVLAMWLTARWIDVVIAIFLPFIAIFALSLPRVFSDKPGAECLLSGSWPDPGAERFRVLRRGLAVHTP